MLPQLSLHPCLRRLKRFCLNSTSRQRLCRDGMERLRVRRLMPPPCRRNNESSFTGISVRWSKSSPEPLKPALRKRRGFRVQRSLAWPNRLAHPALLTQGAEASLEMSGVAPVGIAGTGGGQAAGLVGVKTAAILGAALSLGPLKEEDYMRLLKQAVEPKDRLVLQAGCEHSWPCYGKPAIVFHDRGKIFTSERARHVLVDRLGILT